MIDTLARHLAALSEARRLLSLVLANNPAFEAFKIEAAQAKAADPAGKKSGPAVEPAVGPGLSDDPYFAAYRHISAALALLEPRREPAAAGVVDEPISARVTLLDAERARREEQPRAPLAAPEPPAPEVKPVFSNAQPAVRIVNDGLVYTAPKWCEASVEIVRRSNQSEADALIPPVKARAQKAAKAKTGWLTTLLRL
jgi:hypothetical protein